MGVQGRTPSWPGERGARCEDRMYATRSMLAEAQEHYKVQAGMDIPIMATVQARRRATQET